MQPDRPIIHLNAALDATGDHRGRISSPADLARVHTLREQHAAIGVGARTFRMDMPALSSRAAHLGREPHHQPIRVVFAGSSVVSDHAPQGAPLVAVGASRPLYADCWIPAAPRDFGGASRSLVRLGIATLLLEGGPTLWRASLAAGVVDLLTVWIAVDDPACATDLVRARFDLPSSLGIASTALGGGQLVHVNFN